MSNRHHHSSSVADDVDCKKSHETLIETSCNIYTASPFLERHIKPASSDQANGDKVDLSAAVTGDGNNNFSSIDTFKSPSLGTPFVMDEPMKQKIAKYEQFFREKFACENQLDHSTPSHFAFSATHRHKDCKSPSRVDANSLDTVTDKCSSENRGAQKAFLLLQNDHRKLKHSLSPNGSVNSSPENINRGLLDKFAQKHEQQQSHSSSFLQSTLEKTLSPVSESVSESVSDSSTLAHLSHKLSSDVELNVSMKSTRSPSVPSGKPAIAPKPRSKFTAPTTASGAIVPPQSCQDTESASCDVSQRKTSAIKSKDDCNGIEATPPFKSGQFHYLSLRKYSSPIFRSLRSKNRCKCSSPHVTSQCKCKSSKVSSSFSPSTQDKDVNDQSAGNKDTSYLIVNRRQASLISPCDTVIAELKQKLLTNPPRHYATEAHIPCESNAANSSTEVIPVLPSHLKLSSSSSSSTAASGVTRKGVKKKLNTSIAKTTGAMSDSGCPNDSPVPNINESIDSQSDCDSDCTDNVCREEDEGVIKHYGLKYCRSDVSHRSTGSHSSATSHFKDNLCVKNRLNDRRLSSFSLSSSSTCSSFKSTPPASPYLSKEREDKSLDCTSCKGINDRVQVSSSSTGSNSTITSSSATNDTASKNGDFSSVELTPQAKKLRKLYYIASELTTTEGQFVDKMNLLAVELKTIAEKHLPKEVTCEMFKYLDVLRNVSSHLYKELENALEAYPKDHKIAHVLVHIGPFLNCYSCFMVEFDKLKSTYEDCLRRYPCFASSVKEFEASPRCEKLSVQHFFLKPVQRIPQYRLLFEDYLRNLTEDHVDYDDALKALAIVSTVAEHANKVIKEGDSFMKLLSIQNSLFPSKEIIKPGRIFIKQDDLMKVSRKELQQRRVVLCSDCLLYLTLLQSGLYRLNHEISLDGMRISIEKDEYSAFNNELTIMSPVRSLILKAKSTAERDLWYNAIRTAIDDYNTRKRTFKQKHPEHFNDLPDDSSHSSARRKTTDASERDSNLNDSSSTSPLLGDECPIWIPDDRVTMCQQCSCEFSAFFRRHHCRACGKVICRQCSANRVPLKYRKFRLSRVCDVCFDTLKKIIEDKKNTRSQELRDNSVVDGADAATSPVITMNQDESGESNALSRATLQPTVSITSANGDTASENEFDELLMQFTRIPVRLSRRKPKVKATLKVSGNDNSSDLRGYLYMKVKKSKAKRYWFIVKGKILYRFNASDDVAALHSCPLLGWQLQLSTEPLDSHPADTVFHLSHEGLPTMTFAAESHEQRDLWVNVISASFVL